MAHPFSLPAGLLSSCPAAARESSRGKEGPELDSHGRKNPPAFAHADGPDSRATEECSNNDILQLYVELSCTAQLVMGGFLMSRSNA